MNFKWFASRSVRVAGDMCKQVGKILAAQRDILSTQAVSAVEGALQDTRKAAANGADEAALKKQIENLETVANKWLKPYPNAGMRENVEVLLVALAVAMAIRTFFVQPFKIPTGSMQPTLFGVVPQNLKDHPDVKIPNPLVRIYDAVVRGTFYHYLAAEADGEIIYISQPEHFLKFINKVEMAVRYVGSEQPTHYTFWMTPDDGLAQHAGVSIGDTFHKGDAIVNFREIAGDHLFVDRVTYNFRHPKRGEIIVFETKGIGNEIAQLPPDQFYIKRMVAMGNDKVSIGNDRHLVINGTRLDKNTPHFEKVYSFDPAVPARESQYSGHLNQYEADQLGNPMLGRLAPLFPNQETVYQVRPDHYMVMGDNTANSFDSRAWGDFSRTNVIGKYFFVYWPFSSRFGCGAR